DHKELNKSRIIAIVWVIVSLGLACAVGVLGRAYLFPDVLGVTTQISYENVFIEMIIRIFTGNPIVAFIGGLFLCGILAAIMSTADSQLLVTASAISSDFYKNTLNPKASDEKVLAVSRISVVAVAVIAMIIAWDPNNSIMDLVSDAWAGLGSAFGPLTLLSLYWKRTNLSGAVAGIVSGGAFVIFWDYIPLIKGQTLGAATGIYSLLIGFFFSALCIVLVSLMTKAPDAKMVQDFEEAANK
ncbi:MAG: hypothetical protein HUJ54_11965, partial [Erysipelotrichaceae bacterium]|nr:hypothetical protein [Erysipelotrichaceae bacterium]